MWKLYEQVIQQNKCQQVHDREDLVVNECSQMSHLLIFT